MNRRRRPSAPEILHRWDTGSAPVGQLCRAGWEYSLLRASKGRKHSAYVGTQQDRAAEVRERSAEAV